ncbi:hypothetical protein RhiirC2_708554 [Rhizophagus irregularis]|uniref:Uncharacterized protein n=1 Tax=Rhizophagus irregularis TaxID=588596 RepID=A0A2N1NLW2_9GLOM|nr:hypothetical protein RhiirC2_708554 [Rhizophagus irregularis]
MKIWSDGLDDMGDRGKIKVEKGSTTTTMLRLYIASRDWLLKHTYYYDDETDDWVHHTRMMKKRVYKAHKLLWIYFISFKNLIDANEKSQEKFPNNVDLELLETMFNERSYHPNGINFEKYKSDVIDECYMVCPNNTRFDECLILRKVGAHNSRTHNTHFGQTILGVAYEFMKHEIHMHDQFVFLIMGSILFYVLPNKFMVLQINGKFLNSKYSHLSQLNTYNIFNKNETLIRTDNYPEILFM